jgi:hypothetical protein
MLGMDKHREAGRNVFMSSIQGLANVLAFAAALLLTPKLHGWSVEWVVDYVTAMYGRGLDDLTSLVWFATLGLTVFFTSRATIGTALVLGGLAVITRLM